MTDVSQTRGTATTQEFWLLRLRNNRLSWHSYKDEATREKWAAKYRARGDRVSYDGFIHGEAVSR